MTIEIIKELDIRQDLIIVVLVVMLLDIITGTIGALLNHDFKSTVFRQGLFKKLYELVFIIAGYLLDYVLDVKYIGLAVIYMIIGMELYSIMIENASDIIPLPQWLKDIVENLKAGDMHD